MEFTLLWAALTGVGFAWIALRIWPENLPERAIDYLISAALVGLVAGRLTAMIAAGVNPITNPGDIIIVRGGVSTAAASLAFLGSLIWAGRGRPTISDAVSVATLAGLAGWHAGCLWRGACLGAPSNLPWAWAQEGSLVTRHPVELYAALGLLAAAVVVSRLPWAPWLRTGAGIASAGLIRLITEPLRPSISGGPLWWYAAAVAVGAALVAFSLPRRRDRPPAPT